VRARRKSSWLAGGKEKCWSTGIEWNHQRSATASAALFCRTEKRLVGRKPITDLVRLKKNRTVAVGIAEPLGNIGTFA